MWNWIGFLLLIFDNEKAARCSDIFSELQLLNGLLTILSNLFWFESPSEQKIFYKRIVSRKVLGL